MRLHVAVPTAVVVALATAAVAAPAPALLAAGLDAYAAHDFIRARHVFRALADSGSAIGETMLGTMCARGEGGRRDTAAAAGYYFRAASRGYAPAQLAFARLRARGDGVARDPADAMLWARLAAERGDPRVAAAAQATLGALANGRRLPPESDPTGWRPWSGGRD